MNDFWSVLKIIGKTLLSNSDGIVMWIFVIMGMREARTNLTAGAQWVIYGLAFGMLCMMMSLDKIRTRLTDTERQLSKLNEKLKDIGQ